MPEKKSAEAHEAGKSGRDSAREERLQAALRENLKRRKAQSRGRASDLKTSTQKPKV